MNEIHKEYPSFGNAKDIDSLITEVMHAQARFGKVVTVRVNEEYFKKYFSGEYKDYNVVAGIEVSFDNLLESYLLEFKEFKTEGEI